MNRSELRDRILYRLNEDTSSPTFFTTAQANAVIQEALEIIAEEVEDLREETFISLEPGRAFFTTYEISDRCMTPIRLWSETDEKRLRHITIRQLDHERERWLDVSSDKPDWWYPISHDCFGVWPPTESTGGTLLRVTYLAWPETLLDDTSEPRFRDAVQDLVVMYGMYDGLVRQWDVERALDIFQEFAGSLRDKDFKNTTRRFHRLLTQRDVHGLHFARP